MSQLLVKCLGNLWTQRITFERMGLRLQRQRVLRHPLRYVLMLLATSFELCAVIAFMVQHRGEMVLFSEALMHAIQMVSSLLKMTIFLWQSRALVQLIEEVQLPFSASVDFSSSQPPDEQLQQLWRTQNRRGQLLAAVYFLMCALTSISFLLMPVALTLWRYQTSGQFAPVSSFRVILPYDVTQPRIFLLDCLIMTFVLTFFCCSTTSVDTLYGWFIFGISANYRLLTLRLQRIMAAAGSSTPQLFAYQLSNLFRHHCRLLELVRRFDVAFREIVFVEVLLICLLYCAVICQYIMPHTNQNFAFLGFFSMVVTTQLCIYCFGAEQVRHEAHQFSMHLYELLPWHSLLPSLRRHLLLPLQRAHKETILGSYFFDLGRPLMVWIFRTAGSFTTLLTALREKYE